MSTSNKTKPRSSVWSRTGKLAICAALLVTSMALYPVSPSAPAKVFAEDAASDYSVDQLAALDFLNGIRVKAGVKPLRLSAAITKAAVAHAAYFNTNNTGKVSLSAHDEKNGMPGFTGASVVDRMKAAGWAASSRGYAAGEVMHFNQKTNSQATQGWIDTAYHRAIVLSPDYEEVGIGLVDGTAVMDFGGTGSSNKDSRDTMYVYPYDGATNVGIGFYGGEIPDPLQQFDVEYSGYIISARVAGDFASHTAVITDESGVEVPYNEEVYRNETLFLYPKTILKGHHTYTVTVDYEVEGISGKKQRSWKFTTGEGHKLTGLTPQISQVVINEGETFKLAMLGRYNDGVEEPIQAGLTYSSSNTAGVTVSSAGLIKGIKSGSSYAVQAKSGTLAAKVSVKVLPNLMTKAYKGATDPSKLTDVAGHAASASIGWAVTNGIMDGYSDGTFRPNAYVSEAEFWTMLLKAYKVDINAYAAGMKKKHWADPAYKIAIDRGFPLDGITNTTKRGTAITRLKAAELFASAAGVKYAGYDTVQYVLGMGYMRGKTDSTLSGFGGPDKVTRAEAAQLLEYLVPKLSSLRGRPDSNTPVSELPPMPEREVYVKPAELADNMLVVEYQAEHTLTVEGKFTKQAGKQLNLKVQTGGKKPVHIEDVAVTMDAQGHFNVTAGPYNEQSLNIYLYTDEVIYWIPVSYNTMNVSEFQIFD